MSTKITSLADAIALVPRDALVAIAGPVGARRPLALVRELRRQERSDVRLVARTAGPEAELLGASGLDLVPATAFRAAALGVDFLPTTAGDGPTVVSPVSGASYPVVAAVRPSVALVHAEAADEDGTVLLSDATETWADDRELALAAELVIVSVERLVSRLAVVSRPRDVLLDGARVAAIVHAPFGAHPLPYPGEYPADDVAAPGEPSDDHWAYLDAVGIGRLITLASAPGITTTKESTA